MTKIEIQSAVQVDKAVCKGDKICENICPTGAIKVVQKKAEVNEEKCVACFKCFDACPENAVRFVPRTHPLILGIDPSEINQEKLRELCARAHIDPEQPICLCNGILAKEVAAAVLKGAKSPEEIILMTGVRSRCGIWCTTPVLRLLKAHGVEIIPPEGHRWYNIEPALWDIPEEVAQKYPEYFLEKDAELSHEGTLETFASVIVGRRT